VANLQAQVSNPPQQQQQQTPMNKHGSSWATVRQCSHMLQIHWRLMTGWRQWARCSPQLRVMIGRRSYLLHDDSRGQQEHGGMLMLLLMLRHTPSPGRSSLTASGAITFLQGWWR
jgi:hypothetical protein